MAGALINVINPLLFIASAGLLLVSIVLLILSFARKSRRLRVRALQFAIVPVIFLVVVFALAISRRRQFYREVYPQVPGTYVYTGDTSRFFILLKADSSYLFRQGRTANSGFWSIDPSSHVIRFYNRDRQEGAHTTWRDSAGMKTLVFTRNGEPIELVKMEMAKKDPEKR
jgi:hypothetical protein